MYYDPPNDTKEYIYRIERTNKGLKSQTKSLIFLLPEQKAYLALEKLVEKSYLLNKDGFEVYRQQLLSQQSQSQKDVQEANKQDLTHMNLNVVPEFLQILRLLVQQQENKKFNLS
ncbi:unnamed protein product [Paramecium octaurelia]|uniref:Uncharacterized protein n=1 Tax=Paramecium octaurelia TaxID=43137 RepID=A0A8S1WRN8_PAROT|nr:unnamed protein product [Paramecium octaurelia]